MNFRPDWKHLPSLDTDLSHPFTGIEPIVSGLPYGSLNAAQNRLTQMIRKLQCLVPDIPNIDIASSSQQHGPPLTLAMYGLPFPAS